MHWMYRAATLAMIFMITFSSPPHIHAQTDPPPVQQIVGGVPAAPGAWPWQVLFQYGSFSVFCGGSLIDVNYVLSAAHCFFGRDRAGFTVVLGEHDHTVAEGTEQIRSISEVIIHPNYNPSTKDNDIALVRLNAAATLNNRVKVVPLLVMPENEPLFRPWAATATVTGWGDTTEGGDPSNVLQQVQVRVIDNYTCNQPESYNGRITDNMVCAGEEQGGVDSCQGDSGGPLVVPDGAGGWRIAGIVSWGHGCARPYKYGVYTRVAEYASWIKGRVRPLRLTSDYDGDRRTDMAVWRPSNGNWYIIDSSTGGGRSLRLGQNGDKPAPGDYDGDGRTDLAVWRPSTGYWYIRYSSNGTTISRRFGQNGDKPVPGDYDGDMRTDIAVWRPSNGYWHIRYSSNGATFSQQWGQNGDQPVPGDYDADGHTDFAVWRPSDGYWHIYTYSNGGITQQWGENGDKPVPGDYDGDLQTDFAVWRPSNGNWYIINSSDGGVRVVQWGESSDHPKPGDYENDDLTNITVWRPSNGYWYIVNSSDGSIRLQQWGQNGDIPV